MIAGAVICLKNSAKHRIVSSSGAPSILESADFPGFFLLTQQSFSTRIEVLSGPSWVIIIRANHDVCDYMMMEIE